MKAHTGLLAAIILTLGAAPLPGAELWRLGEFDDRCGEFALEPGTAPETYASDGLFCPGLTTAKASWPYAQPGPEDVWAGSSPHAFDVVFGAGRVPASGECTLKIGVLDSQPDLPPKLRIEVNGKSQEHAFARATTPGLGIRGNFARANATTVAIRFPAALLKPGVNTIRIISVAGSWFVYDAVALDAPTGAEPQAVTADQLRAARGAAPDRPGPAADRPRRHRLQDALRPRLHGPGEERGRVVSPGHDREHAAGDRGQSRSAQGAAVRVDDPGLADGTDARSRTRSRAASKDRAGDPRREPRRTRPPRFHAHLYDGGRGPGSRARPFLAAGPPIRAAAAAQRQDDRRAGPLLADAHGVAPGGRGFPAHGRQRRHDAAPDAALVLVGRARRLAAADHAHQHLRHVAPAAAGLALPHLAGDSADLR